MYTIRLVVCALSFWHMGSFERDEILVYDQPYQNVRKQCDF